MNGKPKLIPAKVPWNISLAVPNIAVRLEELGLLEIEFGAYYLTKSPVQHPTKDDIALKAIVVTFPRHHWGWVRVNPPYGEQGVIAEDDYDWSALPVQRENDSIDSYLNRRMQAWLTTGLYPDPNVYKVQDSVWLKEMNAAQFNLQHYIFLGEDMYVEVLGRDWLWKVREDDTD
jgi:hypothetical protein